MKLKRQAKILELINNYDIETQEELADRLREAGFEVTQATVSRDIRELKLTKVANEKGIQKYSVIGQSEKNISSKYIRVFKEGFVSMDIAQSILVVKTITGMAMAVAAAMDAFNYPEIVGTIAGDDTIFCAVRSDQEALKLMEKLNRILNS
ncbi:MAG TPA: arginine repressor [Defluviitaleaceae bacterium]|jgi:transcriptional regulator of arginine metabolism|nr:arginine repressor [Candidatus Epulonipiscium sp.]HOQ16385.1 arginine repressor [Defluviitaleaceae bacterium]HPT75799.1 arginine repressor [Defluviitaleaceae bacterium]HQD51020.1 arginine repressor [Defluviitaleaceae bacterium]